MNKEIKLFHAQYSVEYSADSALDIYKMILKNAESSGIFINTSQVITENSEIIAQDILDSLTKKQRYFFGIQKGDLRAAVVFVNYSVKLYPEEPFKRRLHIDEVEASTDYLAYLNLLLDMLAGVYVYVIETNEELENR
ncbi:MAG: hypothetical protein AB7F19_03445 [Candidatus Babeliales bacterium]